ncbi:MAG TPA: hypothetical protein VFW00_07600 [Rhodocyclaceae bacterium]|nr:hypothetical protein [Rhodocyclaceae bacterium]
MSSSEPDALIQLFPGVQFQTVGYINMPNIQYSIDPTSAQLIPYVPNAMTTQMVDNPSANPVIGTLDDPGTFYTFNVFNNGHGFLQIVSIRCKGFCF